MKPNIHLAIQLPTLSYRTNTDLIGTLWIHSKSNYWHLIDLNVDLIGHLDFKEVKKQPQLLTHQQTNLYDNILPQLTLDITNDYLGGEGQYSIPFEFHLSKDLIPSLRHYVQYHIKASLEVMIRGQIFQYQLNKDIKIYKNTSKLKEEGFRPLTVEKIIEFKGNNLPSIIQWNSMAKVWQSGSLFLSELKLINMPTKLDLKWIEVILIETIQKDNKKYDNKVKSQNQMISLPVTSFIHSNPTLAIPFEVSKDVFSIEHHQFNVNYSFQLNVHFKGNIKYKLELPIIIIHPNSFLPQINSNLIQNEHLVYLTMKTDSENDKIELNNNSFRYHHLNRKPNFIRSNKRSCVKEWSIDEITTGLGFISYYKVADQYAFKIWRVIDSEKQCEEELEGGVIDLTSSFNNNQKQQTDMKLTDSVQNITIKGIPIRPLEPFIIQQQPKKIQRQHLRSQSETYDWTPDQIIRMPSILSSPNQEQYHIALDNQIKLNNHSRNVSISTQLSNPLFDPNMKLSFKEQIQLNSNQAPWRRKISHRKSKSLGTSTLINLPLGIASPLIDPLSHLNENRKEREVITEEEISRQLPFPPKRDHSHPYKVTKGSNASSCSSSTKPKHKGHLRSVTIDCVPSSINQKSYLKSYDSEYYFITKPGQLPKINESWLGDHEFMSERTEVFNSKIMKTEAKAKDKSPAMIKDIRLQPDLMKNKKFLNDSYNVPKNQSMPKKGHHRMTLSIDSHPKLIANQWLATLPKPPEFSEKIDESNEEEAINLSFSNQIDRKDHLLKVDKKPRKDPCCFINEEPDFNESVEYIVKEFDEPLSLNTIQLTTLGELDLNKKISQKLTDTSIDAIPTRSSTLETQSTLVFDEAKDFFQNNESKSIEKEFRLEHIHDDFDGDYILNPKFIKAPYKRLSFQSHMIYSDVVDSF